MNNRYEAFISYRHAELDSEIAKTVQNQLEHYHLPRKIREKYKSKNLGRVFRDKEELPITSNLTNDIKEALNNSKKLIVICSENTKDSIWVQREIEYFLKTHNKDDILTVLCSGEPQDVIPKILLEDIVNVVNEQGETLQISSQIEPLSCDFRMNRKVAIREEIPRLAAAILECPYDELMQRQHQYFVRKYMSIGILVIVILSISISYLIWSNVKISDNLNQALLNQSDYLANESINFMDEEGDSVLAKQLALSALPYNTNKPYSAKAEYALNNAMKTYEFPYEKSLGNSYLLSTQSRIEEAIISDNNKYVAAVDENYIYIWNRKSIQLIKKIHSHDSLRRIMEFNDKYFLVWGFQSLRCISYETGKTIWDYDLGLNVILKQVVINGKYIIVYSDEDITKLTISNDNGSNEMKLVDAKTIEINEFTNIYPNPELVDGFSLNDHTYCAYRVTKADGTKPILLDYCITDNQYQILPLNFVENEEEQININYSIQSIDQYQDKIYFALNSTRKDVCKYCFYCYSLKDKSIIWKHEIHTDGGLVNGRVKVLKNIEYNGKNIDVLASIAMNQCDLIDLDDGTLIASYVVKSDIINVLCYNNRNKKIELLLSNGKVAELYNKDNDSTRYYYQLKQNGAGCQKVDDNIYVLKNKNIYIYDTKPAQKDWKMFSGCSETGHEYVISPTYMILSDGVNLYAYDLTAKKLLWKDTAYKYDALMYMSTDEKYLFEFSDNYQENDRKVFKRTSISQKKKKEVKLPTFYTQSRIEDVVIKNDVVYFLEKSSKGKKDKLCAYYLSSGKLTSIDTDLDYIEELSLDDYNQKLYVLGRKKTESQDWINDTFCIDLKTNTTLQLFTKFDKKTNMNHSLKIEYSKDTNCYAIAKKDDNHIEVLNSSGKVLNRIECTQLKDYILYKEKIICICDGLQIKTYNLLDGSIIHVSQAIELSYNEPEFKHTRFDIKEGRIYMVNTDRALIVDTEQWDPVAFVPACIAISLDNNIILSSITDFSTQGPDQMFISKLYYHDLVSLEELMQKADNQLVNNEIPDDLKRKYGI